MTVASGRVGGKIVNTVISYQPDGDNSQGHLHEVVLRTLGEFGLSGKVL
jgi:O-antigen ligase